MYLTTKECAERLRTSERSIHGLTSARAIPHRKLRGQRRLLFLDSELDAWLAGSDLETIEKQDGSVIVRPVTAA